jgi:YidC/Oxa1 family membrane protein insertase
MSRTLIALCLLTIGVGAAMAAPTAMPAAPAPGAPAQPAISAAAPLSSQDGLPPELIIAPSPALAAQLQALQGLQTWIESQHPQGRGFLDSLTNMFSRSSKPQVRLAQVLVQSSEAFRGQLVEVSGIYHQLTADTATFATDGGVVRISLPQGITIQGFPEAGPAGLPVAVEGIVEGAGSFPQIRASSIKPSPWLTLLRIGRIQELMGQQEVAEKTYAGAAMRVPPSDFAAFAKTSAARLTYEQWRAERDPDKRKTLTKRARGIYSMAWNTYGGLDRKGHAKYETWWPNSSGLWEKMPVHTAIGPSLDSMNRNDIWYRFMDFFVLLAGGNHWLGIVFLSIISRVVIWPLTKKQLASAEAMKRLQPQIKALQDRHTDDKQKFQEEFWKLCQANGVNPLGGCLPMVVQFPILIMLWQGIRNYIVQFQGHGFLWVRDLASPDYGLLIAYTISMVFFQKMTQKLQPAPTMNAQQAQQQQMMTYMMPAMFFFFFQNFPAAFLLYWLATNVVYFVQQYSYTRSVARKQQSDGTETMPPASKPGGFAGAMTRMMSMKSEENVADDKPAETRSFHEKQADSRGKKVGRPDAGGGSNKSRK